MFSGVNAQLIDNITNAALRPYPYPHFYCQSVFPDGFYQEIISHLPSLEKYQPISDTSRIKKKNRNKQTRYKDRYIITLTSDDVDAFDDKDRAFWKDLTAILGSTEFAKAVLLKFRRFIQERFGDRIGQLQFLTDIQLICDNRGYSLGPHTDYKDKVAVVLFYLPQSDQRPDLGTSLYVPKDKRFICEGGPHHDFKDFDRVFTAAYLPNTALSFFKTNNSFHGVEPLKDAEIKRNVIQLSIIYR